MSDNIPFEIQVEIIKRVLPVKSLIRFTSVSKQWKSVIHSSQFITNHSVNQTKLNHLLVMNKLDPDTYTDQYHFDLFVDDDCFPRHMFSPYVPPTVELVTKVLVLDCSHGLVCLYGHYEKPMNKLVVFWNPSIRKSVGILLNYPLETWAVGFGVCPQTSEPKIVTIIRASSSMDWYAEVFTLSSVAWRSIPVNLPLSIYFDTYDPDQVVIDGVIHWRAYERITNSIRIVTFDLTNEEFGEVHLPDSFKGTKCLAISKFKESLVVAKYLQEYFYDPIQDVWMSNADLKSLFMEQYSSIKESGVSAPFKIIGYRKNGEPIFREIYDIGLHLFASTLIVFDPCSKQFKGVYNSIDSAIKMTSYSESLLLLNHNDSMIQTS